MKTIQEHLREADRKRLLDCLAYRFLSDPIQLLEAKEYTVQEIMERYSGHMNSFVERLLGTDSGRSDTHVFYLYPGYENDETPDLVDLRAIEADIDAPGLDFTFTDWHEALGYLVADTKLTQDNLILFRNRGNRQIREDRRDRKRPRRGDSVDAGCRAAACG